MKKIYCGYFIAGMLLVQSCQKTEEFTNKNFKPKTQSGLRSGDGGLFYYAGNEKIPLTEDSTAVIFFDADSSKMLSILRKKGNGVAITRLNSGYFLVEKKSKSAITSLSSKAITQNVFKSIIGKRIVPNGEIVVKLKTGFTIDRIIQESAGKLKLVGAKKRGWYLLRLNGQASLLDIANGLQESGKVQYSYPNFIANVKKSSDDPLFSSQYYLHNTGINGGVAGIDINLGTTPYGINTNIKVAVIDDGVEAHEDLAGRLLQGFTPGHPTEFGAPDAASTTAHGQACAGIIGATRDNNIGIAGIAPLAKIIPVNIFKSGVSEQDIADAINWAWDEGGADVINNSWGIYNNAGPVIAIEEAINNALTLGRSGKGSVVVFSSGNDNEPFTIYPSGLPGVITVGAINKQGNRQSYSSYGAGMDLVAPSGAPSQTGTNGLPQLMGDVWSTDRMGSAGYVTTTSFFGGNYVNLFGGTSAAAPQVSGAAALLLSHNPNLTRQEVENYLTSTATDQGTVGYDQYYGYGRLNLSAAISSYMNTIGIVTLVSGPQVQICVNIGEQATYNITVPPGSSVVWNCFRCAIVGPNNLTTVTIGGGGFYSGGMRAQCAITIPGYGTRLQSTPPLTIKNNCL